MEREIAILIADLSGFTALTDIHGPNVAADLVDTYLELVDSCLVGDSLLHQRVGDEVVLVASSADQLLATACQLLHKARAESGFLQLHGGLHYGPVLMRKESYFGTTVNLASRIAALADPGTICCSPHFLESLTQPAAYPFHSKGLHRFKNLNEDYEIFELQLDPPPWLSVDPVCRMMINRATDAILHPTRNDLYFCSRECLDIYLKASGDTLQDKD